MNPGESVLWSFGVSAALIGLGVVLTLLTLAWASGVLRLAMWAGLTWLAHAVGWKL